MPNNFGKWLQMQLLEKDSWQNDCAEHMGVSPATVSDWCCNRTQPAAHRKDRLATYLGVTRKTLDKYLED